jgi:hypothetical protein
MIEIKGSLVVIEFKKGPARFDSENCVRLCMEILNLSYNFGLCKKDKNKTGKKMNKTGRIREGVNKYVNKNNVTPQKIEKLICSIRKGNIREVTAFINDEEISLLPNNDVPGVIAKLMIERII